MSTHINADLYADKSDVTSTIEELKKLKSKLKSKDDKRTIEDAIDILDDLAGEMEDDYETDEMIEMIEDKGITYEIGEMLAPDSEVEIDIQEGKVYLCDYSASRGGALQIEELCDEDDVDTEQLIRMCDSHDWSYVI